MSIARIALAALVLVVLVPSPRASGQGSGQKRGFSAPSSPGVQNRPQASSQHRPHSSGTPFSPGFQNRSSPFAPGFQNQTSRSWIGSPSFQPQPWQSSTVQPGFYDQPAYDYQPQPVYSQLPIKLIMPHEQSGICSYALLSQGESWNYAITPGHSQTFAEDRAWTIRFDRGDGYGVAAYRLKPGIYRFRQSGIGWELYRSH